MLTAVVATAEAGLPTLRPGQGLGGSSHTAVRSGLIVQGSYTQPWTREAHWNEASTQSRGTRGASCMIRWSIWLHMAA